MDVKSLCLRDINAICDMLEGSNSKSHFIYLKITDNILKHAGT
jgi:hypothetical protein